jgi:hypothetical protein
MRRRLALLVMLVLAAGSPTGRTEFTSYSDVRAVLEALADILPAELRSADGAQPEAAWSGWRDRHDRDIRARLERGDEDTIVNWLLFGTSFTSRPRAILDLAPAATNAAGAAAADLSRLIAERARDLVSALVAPGNDERRLFGRRFFERQGYPVANATDRSRLVEHLRGEVTRAVREQEGYSRELVAARQLRDSSQEFAVRSKLYRERGLSLDTSILPSFALERALQQMLAQGLLEPGSVRRVAVIGPGLDFSDKGSGYDFYPQQTLQPFALADTLLRLGLVGSAAAVQITAFDISPRVNDHLTRARARAGSGSSYVLHLPLDAGIAWKSDVVEYWKHVGERIGAATRDAKPAAVGRTVEVRTLRVRPQIALRVTPENLNIVVQRFDGAPFDLVVATNVFVYYDTLDQCLALANVEAMLRPGGLLLSNNALLELPASRMRSVGYVTVQYSDRLDDGDHVVWYRRSPD